MARRCIRSFGPLPLLTVLLFCTAAAASEQEAVRAARAAIDHARLDDAQKIIDAALSRLGNRDSEAVWALRVMRVEAVLSRDGRPAAKEELKKFTIPGEYAHSATAVHWWIIRALAAREEKLLGPAEKLARERHPALLADVFMYRSSINGNASHAHEALRLARERNRTIIEAKAMTNIAYLLASEGRFAESIERGEQAVAMAKRLRLPKLQQAAEGNLGWAYFELGEYERAEALFANAERTARQIKARFDLPVWLVQLGNIELQKRNWARAAHYNREAAELAAKVERRDELGYALANLARIAIEQGRLEEAAAFNRRALEAKQGNEEALLSSQVVDAQVAAATGDRDRARAIFESVLVRQPPFPTRIEAETHLAKLYVSSGEQEKARMHFARAARVAREGRDKITNRDLRFAFFNTVADMFDAYVDFLVRTGAVYEALAVTETSRAQLLRDGRGVAPSFDPRAVARASDATILCYWLGRTRSYVWVVTADAVKVKALPPDMHLEKRAQDYRDELLGPDAEASVAVGRELFQLLVPSLPFPKDSRIIVVADGGLHTLNFEALVTPLGRYWIEDVVVVNAASLKLAMGGQTRSSGSPSVLLVGNPRPDDSAFPVLLHAQEEIDRIGLLFDRRTVLQGAQATPEAFKYAARERYDFVHVAAHGVASHTSPLDSAVILAARDRNSSYKLLARDVVKLPLDARLVTISSCHGAGTRTYAGEGVVGLAWAFLKAGADQVIAALWEVDDAATPALMQEMYVAIRKGSDPADALRMAKLRLVNSRTSHRYPRYWAPFVLYAGN